MQLFTFLGIGRYSPTLYVWNDQEQEASFAPAASVRFLQAEEVAVFLTKDVREEDFATFTAAMPAGVAVQPVPVPLGQNSAELWEIFSIVTERIQPGRPAAFDITHGLRSFPLIGLLVSAFLRASRRADLQAVLYGAFDVRDQTVTPNRTPMFDLTPMLDLLEWASAADRFTRTGDARYLASLGKRQQKALAIAAAGDRQQLAEVGALGNLAGALTGISQALGLIRPHQAMESIAGLQPRIEAARPALARSAPAQPLSILLDQIAQAYEGLGLDSPGDPALAATSLATQRRMVAWYIEREQWVQAVTLIREWLVSWVMVQLGQADLLDPDARESVESVLGSEHKAWLRSKEKGSSFTSSFLTRLHDVEPILDLWGQVTQTRNDINHAAMRRNPSQPESLTNRIEGYLGRINELPLPQNEAETIAP